MHTVITKSHKQHNINPERRAIIANINWVKNDEAIPEGMRARITKRLRRQLKLVA